MLKVFNNLALYSIKTKIITCFLVLSLLPMTIFGFFAYKFYLEDLRKNVISYTYEVIERVDKNIVTYISDIENILDIRNDYYILQYLKLNEANDIEGNRTYTVRIWETFNGIKKMKTDLADIKVTAYTGETISCYGIYWTDVSSDCLYNALLNKEKDSFSIQPPHINILNKNVFSIAKVIDAPTLYGQNIMSIDVDVEFLNRICNDIKLGERGYVYLIDKNGGIVYLPINLKQLRHTKNIIKNPALFYSEKGHFIENVDGNNLIVTFKTSEITDWKLVAVSYEDEIAKDINKLEKLSLIVMLLSLALVLLLSLYFSNILTRPIKELKSVMKRVAQNDLAVNIEIKSFDEIGQLAQSFNKMVNKIRVLVNKIIEDQRKIRKMEMKALQELIKPHFVYNTLDSIIGLLEQKKTDKALILIESLGKFFRTSLSHGKEIISIREELEHVRCYLLIQQFRFSNKFDYLIEVDNGILNHKVIKLILQPLVENSIYHGIRNSDKKGLIVIKGYIKEEEIIFEIVDNGKGIEESALEHINSILSGTEQVKDENMYFGIRNVNERIKITFGNRFGLRYQSKFTGGTKAIIHIPLME